MWMIKPLKNGKTAVIFDEGIFPQVSSTDGGYIVTAALPAALTKPVKQSESLSAVKKRVETSGNSKTSNVQLSLNPVVRDVESIEVFDVQKQGDIIASLALEKIARTYGSPLPVYLKGFYNTIERDFGVPISRIHKDRTRGIRSRHKGDYPYRKIDTVLSLIPADEVYKKAKQYEF